jgi:cell division initiation protein
MDPDDIEAREFPTSLRGYDREAVDSFLRDVAAEVRRLRSALAQEAVISAGPQTDAAPAADAADAYRQVGDETARILVAAEQAAREIKERGQREVAELLADAREQAAAIARAAVVDRQNVEDDIRQLQEARALLGTEMEDLRRRFEELVLRLRQPFETRRPRPKAPEAKRPPAESPWAPEAPEAEAPPAPAPAKPAGAAFFSPAQGDAAAGGDDTPEPAPREEPAAAALALPAGAEEEPAASESVVVITSEAAAPAGETPAPGLGDANQNGGPSPDAGGQPRPPAVAAGGAVPPDLPPPPRDPQGALDWRASALGDMPEEAARRLKRLLQDDQNELLERLRAWRGVGPAANHVPPPDVHGERFKEGLRELLQGAFSAGRRAGGSDEAGDPNVAIGALVTKQLVTPLRRDLLRLIEPPPGWDTSATAASKRASDVYRVWKGVRTDLLGEGLVYAVFHQGILDAVKGDGAASKEWVLSADERNCPRDVCRSNATAGPVGLEAPFASGHLVPPAHGGCTCTLLLVRS